MITGAHLSDDRVYRYSLWRIRQIKVDIRAMLQERRNDATRNGGRQPAATGLSTAGRLHT